MVEDMLAHVHGNDTPPKSDGQVRFMLLTVPRSGTMMLANALEADPAVRLHNFYAANPERSHQSLALWDCFQWGEYPPEVTHLGTTMHFVGQGWQQHCPIPLSRLWPMLEARHDKVVILYRLNLLRQYLSHIVGVYLKSYDVLRPRDEKGTVPPLEIDLESMGIWIADIRRLLDLRPLFPDALQIPYELLSSRWSRYHRMVRDYLELPAIADQPPITHKQETRPLRDAIANYDDVAAWCRNDGHPEWSREDYLA